MAELYRRVNGMKLAKAIAKMDGVQAALEAEAQSRATVARAVLAAHRDTGHSHIEVTSGRVDRYVSLVDQGGNPLAIEFGRGEQRRVNPTTGQEYTIAAAEGIYPLSIAFGRRRKGRR